MPVAREVKAKEEKTNRFQNVLSWLKTRGGKRRLSKTRDLRAGSRSVSYAFISRAGASLARGRTLVPRAVAFARQNCHGTLAERRRALLRKVLTGAVGK